MVLYSYSPGVKHGFQQADRPRIFLHFMRQSLTVKVMADWKMLANTKKVTILKSGMKKSYEDQQIDENVDPTLSILQPIYTPWNAL